MVLYYVTSASLFSGICLMGCQKFFKNRKIFKELVNKVYTDDNQLTLTKQIKDNCLLHIPDARIIMQRNKPYGYYSTYIKNNKMNVRIDNPYIKADLNKAMFVNHYVLNSVNENNHGYFERIIYKYDNIYITTINDSKIVIAGSLSQAKSAFMEDAELLIMVGILGFLTMGTIAMLVFYEKKDKNDIVSYHKK